MKLQDKVRIARIVRNNNDLREIVSRLQQLDKPTAIQAVEMMELPLSKHMFIMGNFSALMEVKL